MFKCILLGLGALLTVSCTTIEKNYEISRDIPDAVVNWANDNVWQVTVGGGTGSAFAVSSDIFITACHVVQGREEAQLVTLRDTRMLFVKVESCNEKTDISVLSVKEHSDIFITEPTWVEHGKPEQGQAVYGTGYPLGMPLVITSGHIQLAAEREGNDEYVITANTIFGDSGSPVVTHKDGVITVVGIRLAIRGTPFGFGSWALLPHITIMGSPASILQELKEYHTKNYAVE